MGEGIVTGPPSVVTSSGIGSCVVLILYDNKERIGGLAHIMLPIVNRNPGHERRRAVGTNSPSRHADPVVVSIPGYNRRQAARDFSPYQYADTAVSALLKEMVGRGSARGDITARLVGGGRMFVYYEDERESIGIRNIESIRGILKKERIPVIGSDTGGSSGRNLRFMLESGSVTVYGIGGWIREI